MPFTGLIRLIRVSPVSRMPDISAICTGIELAGSGYAYVKMIRGRRTKLIKRRKRVHRFGVDGNNAVLLVTGSA